MPTNLPPCEGSRSSYAPTPRPVGRGAEALLFYSASQSSAVSVLPPVWFTQSRSLFHSLVSEAERVRRRRLAVLLQSWRAGDRQEQSETFTVLRTSIDQDRTSDRRLFE
jgi:hypothetical protein